VSDLKERNSVSEPEGQNRPIRTVRLTEVFIPYDDWNGTCFNAEVVGGDDGPDDPLYEVRYMGSIGIHLDPVCELLSHLNDINPPPEAVLRKALRDWHGVEVEIVKEDI
jgi:hypothetical protein